MATLAELKAIAIEIKNATAIGANTAAKVGALVEAIIDAEIIHNNSIDVLNEAMFPTPVYVTLDTDEALNLTAENRIVAVNAATEHAIVNLPADSTSRTTFTIVNVGVKSVDLTAPVDETINLSLSNYVLASGLALTIMKFKAENAQDWFVIGT